MVISMIFDLATFKLVIAFVAITSTATAQIQFNNGQVVVYTTEEACKTSNVSEIVLSVDGSLAGSAENNCVSACNYLDVDGERYVKVYDGVDSEDKTTAYFFTTANSSIDDCGPPGGNFAFQRSDDDCKQLLSEAPYLGSGVAVQTGISAFTGQC
jgi:hypothetical protein